MRRGKAICEALKDVRRKIAQANDISYTPNVCNHEGECAGSCAACEKEVRYLEHQLHLRRLAGQTVRVAGLSLGMVAMLSSCFHANGYMERDPNAIEEAVESIDTMETSTEIQPADTLQVE